MTIKLLDAAVVAQIAAGEVVERPAAVVKELLENALDAGATQITVEVRGGGTTLIRVIDNGSGIAAAEVEMAFSRHATSKISRLEDINNIHTLGFRGEALASIAAVAEIDLLTRARNETLGTHMILRGGKIVVRESRVRAPGTTVSVSHLFREVPARRKFLKKPATENSHAINITSQYALAYPEVAFQLLIEDKVTLSTPGSGRMRDAFLEVYGSEVVRGMLEIVEGEEWSNGGIKVYGLVGTPPVARSSRSYLSFFVNRRWVNNRTLGWMIEKAYQGLLMTDQHPIAVIGISLPPSEVDVNVHPTKTEVKFANEAVVFGVVQRAVRSTLIRQMPVPRIEEVAMGIRVTPDPKLAEGVLASPIEKAMPVLPLGLIRLPILRVLGQLARSYIVAEGEDGLYLIDQHAAHERVRYEQLLGQRAKQGIEVQALLALATFEVTASQALALKAGDSVLGEFGFKLEPFGERTWLVRTVPTVLTDRDWSAALRELLEALGTSKPPEWTERLLQLIACHSAVRAGQVMAEEEMRELVRQLEQAEQPRTCPHGRPTMLQLGMGQIKREFGRS